MSYLKFKADYIFTGSAMLHRNHVLIINEQGIVQEIVDAKDAGDNVQQFKGMLTPGFVNCHCHLELSHMKGIIPNRTGLVDFILQVLQHRSSAEETIYEAMRNAEMEMYNGGIVAVGDISNTIQSIGIKQKSKIYWHNFIEVLGFTETNAAERFDYYENIYQQFTRLQTTNSKPQTSLVPHAPYTISNKMFQLINNISAGKTVSIHNQECAAEDELYKNKTGGFLRLYDFLKIDTSFFQPSSKSSLQTYLPLLGKVKNLLLVHNTYTSQEDIDFIKQQSGNQEPQIFFCLCPNANLYIEGRLPPVNLLRKNNCNIVLGTDGYSSNWSLGILDEIRRIQQESAYSIGTEEILQWATLNGAKALQMDDRIGSFEKGKQPGVVVIDEMVNQNITTKSTAKRII